MIMMLFALLSVMQLLDWYSTRTLIKAGKAHEANPVMAFPIKHLGLDLGLLVPKAVVLALAYTMLMSNAIALGLLCVVYVAVLVNNFKLLRK